MIRTGPTAATAAGSYQQAGTKCFKPLSFSYKTTATPGSGRTGIPATHDDADIITNLELIASANVKFRFDFSSFTSLSGRVDFGIMAFPALCTSHCDNEFGGAVGDVELFNVAPVVVSDIALGLGHYMDHPCQEKNENGCK